MKYGELPGPKSGPVLNNDDNIDFYIADAEDQVATYALMRIKKPNTDCKSALEMWNRRLKLLKEMKSNGTTTIGAPSSSTQGWLARLQRE